MQFKFVLVEQPGVLACLSRRRSWVQIPSGTLDSTVRKLEKRRSSNLRDFVSSTLTRATDWVVFLVAACKTVVTKQARWTTRGSIPSRPTVSFLPGGPASSRGSYPLPSGATPEPGTVRNAGRVDQPAESAVSNSARSRFESGRGYWPDALMGEMVDPSV